MQVPNQILFLFSCLLPKHFFFNIEYSVIVYLRHLKKPSTFLRFLYLTPIHLYQIWDIITLYRLVLFHFIFISFVYILIFYFYFLLQTHYFASNLIYLYFISGFITLYLNLIYLYLILSILISCIHIFILKPELLCTLLVTYIWNSIDIDACLSNFLVKW